MQQGTKRKRGKDLQSIIDRGGPGAFFGAILRIFWMCRRIRSTAPHNQYITTSLAMRWRGQGVYLWWKSAHYQKEKNVSMQVIAGMLDFGLTYLHSRQFVVRAVLGVARLLPSLSRFGMYMLCVCIFVCGGGG